MLRPAIIYKDQIESALKQYFYSAEMLYYMGWNGSELLHVDDSSDGSRYQYAVINKDEKLIGYLSYSVDLWSSCAHNFGAFSFEKGNPLMGKELNDLMEKLIKKYHRVDFRAVGGNPAVRGYDAFLRKHSDLGRKVVLKDDFRDADGKFHDMFIYEFINPNSML